MAKWTFHGRKKTGEVASINSENFIQFELHTDFTGLVNFTKSKKGSSKIGLFASKISHF